MKAKITYSNNNQIWKIESAVKAHGFRQTEECYWAQIFEDENGNEIVCSREWEDPETNPMEQLEKVLAEIQGAQEAQKAQKVKGESPLDMVAAELEARKDRSAWDKGVNAYALELVEEIKERAEYEGRNPESEKECREWMLNGAQDWAQYSWGGSSLIYDADIAERLCTPSELKKTRHGERRPNSREEWLDTQARALTQACNRVARAYRSIVTVL